MSFPASRTTQSLANSVRGFPVSRGIIAMMLYPTLFCVVAAAQDSKRTNVEWPMYNGSYAADRSRRCSRSLRLTFHRLCRSDATNCRRQLLSRQVRW